MDDAPRLLLWGVPELRAGRAIVFSAERRFQLLVVLALQNGHWIERDRVAALLWPEHALPEARRNLRKVIFKARAVAADVEASATALRWPVPTDFQAFEEDRRAGRLAAALAWRRGAPLLAVDDPDNATFGGWLAAERARVEQVWQSVAMDHLQMQSAVQDRIDAARLWLTIDPAAEAAVAALVQAEVSRGQVAQAHAEFQRYAAHLAEEFGVEPSQALRRLLDSAPADVVAPQIVAAGAGDGFIGRRSELAELAAMLGRAECRLITVVGPGGIGKSSLARRAMALDGAQGVGTRRWLELQDLSDLGQFVARLAGTLGAEIADTQDPVEPLAAHLGTSTSLLVLDNAEHLEGLAALLDRLLVAAPTLRVLLTSRQRLHCTNEWLLSLPGLAVPDAESRDLEAASTFDAVRLFEARAAQAQRNFRLADHLPAVIDIVEAVDGMPLAIELAAGWVRLLPPAEIARELRASNDLLEQDPSTAAPARPVHVSLRAVLQQSWSTLAPSERAALADLSVFRGGFVRSAAAAVAEVSMPLLSSLIDRSLLALDVQGRFSMHPLVMSFASERAREAPQRAAAVQRRHAEHFARAIADAARQHVRSPKDVAAGIELEFANIMAAWRLAVDIRSSELVCTMVPALWPFFEVRGRIREAIAVFSPALDLPDNQPMSRRALTWLRQALAMLHCWIGAHEQGLVLAESGIASGEDCGDREALIGCLIHAATCLWNLGRYAQARPHCDRAVGLSRQCGDRHLVAWSLNTRGTVEHALGAWDAAIDCLTEALQIDRELGHLDTAAQQSNNLGAMLRERGRWAEARARLEDGLRLAQASGNLNTEPYLRKNLGACLWRLGEFDAARKMLQIAAARGSELGLPLAVLAADRELAHLLLNQGQFAAALQAVQRLVDSAQAQAQSVDIALGAALFGDWLAATGQADRAHAVWRCVALAPMLSQSQRDELAAKLRSTETSAQPPTTLEEVVELLRTTHAPARRV